MQTMQSLRGSVTVKVFRTINLVLMVILRSPLHRLLSKHLLLITYRGRTSGTVYTIPVAYQRQDSELRIVSMRHDRWWRNLRGGAPVTLQLQGRSVTARGRVIEAVPDAARQLMTYLQHAPTIAKILGMTRDGHGQFRQNDVQQAAKKSVVVHLALHQE